MKRLIATWRATLSRVRRGVSPRDPSAVAQPSPRDDRETARRLADAIECAMQLGLWDHVQRIAESAIGLADHHPHLTDRLARLRLAQGQPEIALTIIDSCTIRPASLRLLRAECLLKLGRRIEAHLDLREWSRRASAPLQARLMLALLEWHDGDTEAALEALRRNLRHLEDPRTLTALLLMNVALGRRDSAALWADRLRNAGAWSAAPIDIDLLLDSLNLPASSPPAANTPSADRIAMLAAELQANEAVIPALAAAQRLNPQPRSAAMLAQALQEALPELQDSAAAHQALAQVRLAGRQPADDDVVAKIGDVTLEIAA